MRKKQQPCNNPVFQGKERIKNIVNCLVNQVLIAGNRRIATKIANIGNLATIKKDEVVFAQNEYGTDIYFILSGSVCVTINDREIAVREARSHIGEMSLLDPTATRSASIIGKEETILFKVSASKLEPIINKHPDILKRIAIELANRLRERSKFIHEPNSKNKIFIGSSSEALKIAEYIKKNIATDYSECSVWSDGVFSLSKTTIENLIEVSKQYDFAVLVLSPDDMTHSRKKKVCSPRDNVVFELGLFIGALGRDRTYIVVQSGVDLKLPSDLLGVTVLNFHSGSSKTLSRRLENTVNSLKKTIIKLGPR
jgi:predicted nucleotide-binding protein